MLLGAIEDLDSSDSGLENEHICVDFEALLGGCVSMSGDFAEWRPEERNDP